MFNKWEKDSSGPKAIYIHSIGSNLAHVILTFNPRTITVIMVARFTVSFINSFPKGVMCKTLGQVSYFMCDLWTWKCK